MTQHLDPWNLVAFLGSAHAVVVGTALLTVAGPLRRLFGLLLLCLGICMTVILYSHTAEGGEPLLAGVLEDSLSLLAPALLFAFVQLVLERSWKRALLWQSAIPLGWTLHALSLLAFGHPDLLWRPPIEGIVAYQAAYTAVCAHLVFGRPARAATSKMTLRWARRTVTLIAFVHGAQVVRFFVDSGPLRDVVPMTSAVVVIALTFLAVRESGVFAELRGDGAARERSPAARYAGSSLSRQRADRSWERLQHLLHEDRIFLQPNLTLEQLCDEVGLARTYLSQLINERSGKTLLELLAECRVAEAERLFREPATEHLTVEALGERAGFQSKSAFYAAFKRLKGTTPAAYRRELKHRSSALEAALE